MRISRTFRALFSLLFLPVTVAGTAAFALDDFWTGATDTDWNTGTNWNGGVAPSAGGDTGRINIDGTGGGLLINAAQTVPNGVGSIRMGAGGSPANNAMDATIQQTASDVNVADFVLIGDQPDHTGTYTWNISGGSLNTASGEIVIGKEATGVLNASGTSVIDTGTNSLLLGEEPGGVGTLTVSDNAKVTSAEGLFAIRVGESGSGTVMQTGGTVEATAALIEIGREPGGMGTYDISGGTLSSVNKLTLGREGTGELSVSGTGTVDVRSLVMGDAGTGNITQTGGSVLVATSSNIGGAGGTQSSAGFATYDMSDGVFTSTVRLLLGRGNVDAGGNSLPGMGTINQDGGDVTAGEVHIGGRLARVQVGNGVYNISAGTLTADDANRGGIVVGTELGSVGELHASGTAQVTSAVGIRVGPSDGTGLLSLTGPDVTMSAESLEIGANGTLDINSGSGISPIVVNSALGTTLAGSLLVDLSTWSEHEDVVLIDNVDALATVAGQFLGLPENALVPGTGLSLPVRITYQGGDGNDVALNVVPEPSTISLLATVAVMALAIGGRASWRRRALRA